MMENHIYVIADWISGVVFDVVAAPDGKTALAQYHKPVPEIPDYRPPCTARYRVPEIVSNHDFLTGSRGATTVAVKVPNSWARNPRSLVDPRRAEAVALADWGF